MSVTEELKAGQFPSHSHLRNGRMVWTCDLLASLWVEKWPRPAESSNRQNAIMVADWGRQNTGRELWEYTREEAREYALAHPSRVPFLRNMWGDAVREKLVETNVFAALRLTPPKRQLTMPTPQELEMLLRAAEEPLRGRIAFAAYTGLRRGELLHLRPCDFETMGGDAHGSDDNRSPHVARPGVDDGSGPTTSRGRWRVHVEWQINANGEKARIKGRVKDRWAIVPEPARKAIASLLLATAPDERLWPIHPRVHDKQWRKVRATTRLTHLRFHDLRHFAASWFLDHGASYHDVGVQLGHDDNGTEVRDTYGHLDRGKALERLEGLIADG